MRDGGVGRVREHWRDGGVKGTNGRAAERRLAVCATGNGKAARRARERLAAGELGATRFGALALRKLWHGRAVSI